MIKKLPHEMQVLSASRTGSATQGGVMDDEKDLSEFEQICAEFEQEFGYVAWAYDFAYGTASDFVHPRPVGMRAHVTSPGARLKIDRTVDQQ